eukprot:TRINITY_DN8573_c0_g1_i1.p1 TRINITY_DN8573_c0_g1~~TRINITY_DN8573_c0_g1_i1.p1  ORF type:complete len:246 (-),score=53.78 TRINITY_DN8573_c0_g1_i1:139-876(-)
MSSSDQQSDPESTQRVCDHGKTTPTVDLIRNRRSKRSFHRDKEVTRAIIEDVLRASIRAPSSRNLQPWSVAVVRGSKRDELGALIMEASQEPPTLKYTNRPAPENMPEEWKGRLFDHGASMYGHLGIAREDKERRSEQEKNNLRFFDAPCELIFHLPAASVGCEGVFMAMGFFIQNVVMGLESHGVSSCLQVSIAKYSDIICKHLGLKDRVVAVGCSVGYAIEEAPINTFVASRIDLDESVQWHE